MMGNLDARFREYHAKNPHVYEQFKEAAIQMRQAGRAHFGAKCIMEYVRFQTAVHGTDPQGFKINNNYTSRYVRLLETEHPAFKGFFAKRTIGSSISKTRGGKGSVSAPDSHQNPPSTAPGELFPRVQAGRPE